ncbi:hypothetical protein C497_02312 [Halalkalicoccus jeotgali B3]|uniref:Uncharacterized protein n=1 Tax=Halalkalicoccus jeotgali (strain DSM 18796 / CECT 7217 / JCM 14584 / KCTC 4019 / B3) TaxID=795797 RepID=D8JBU2_HALJB|nr:hypothetical protein HacjB3_16976 [Halalkalicoccus jeotgali B3]ELY40879.1 hypothetical protein C497_02312 [Halalkalicoccus jeotgali B3]
MIADVLTIDPNEVRLLHAGKMEKRLATVPVSGYIERAPIDTDWIIF